MTPCLTIVGGIGMDEAARREWLHAAWIVLEDMPHDLLKRGAREAMTIADHPSKIIPAITKATQVEWAERKARRRAEAQLRSDIAATVALTQSHRALEDANRNETTAQILARNWPTMHMHEPGRRENGLNLNPERECRRPTREDYLRMGVPAEHIDAAPSSDGNPPRDNA